MIIEFVLYSPDSNLSSLNEKLFKGIIITEYMENGNTIFIVQDLEDKKKQYHVPGKCINHIDVNSLRISESNSIHEHFGGLIGALIGKEISKKKKDKS